MIREVQPEDAERMTTCQLIIAQSDYYLYDISYIDETNGVITNVETKDVRIRESDGELILISEIKNI